MFRSYLLTNLCFFVLCVSSLHAIDCNPLGCYYFMDKVFHHDENYDMCPKLKKVDQCVHSCLTFLPKENFTVVSNSLLDLKNHVCSDTSEFSNHWSNKCINSHKFRLLSCIFNSWSLESEIQSNSDLLLCRKIFEAENCPRNILLKCDTDAQDFVEKIVIIYFESLKKKACLHFSVRDVWDLRMKRHISNENSESTEFATCFDSHHKKILSCIPSKWTANMVLSRHYKQELCISFLEFKQCVADIISKNCKSEILNTFNSVAESAYYILLPYCVGSSSVSTTIPPAKTVNNLLPQLDGIINDEVQDQNASKSEQQSSEIKRENGTDHVHVTYVSNIFVKIDGGSSNSATIIKSVNAFCVLKYLFLITLYVFFIKFAGAY